VKKEGFLQRLIKKNFSEETEDFEDLNSTEKDMIRGIVELSDTAVKEIMVPRIDVVFISSEMSFSDMMSRLIESGHSRFPVFKETIDNVVGILYVKDLLVYFYRGEEIDIESVTRKAFFVPESKKCDSLLREMRKKRVHIAVVVDEYGGVSGIVCLEDILEEIVGEIQDEFDNEVEDILELETGVYLCDARVDIEDLNESLSTELPEEDFDTLGGFVFDLFGKIPVKFEKVSYRYIDFIIQDMEGHKIRTVKLVLQPDRSEKKEGMNGNERE
jgi:CBS domain containing-hemolysin-like protein